jgi:AcrR family transcriptional regulator
VSEWILTPEMAATARTLSTAEDRREAVIQAGMKVVAEHGISGTPTAEVAKAAGISHAYLFRLFATKNELAVAIVERANQRVYDAFAGAAAAAGGDGEEKLHAMGIAYGRLLADRELLLVQLHSHAAAADNPAIRDAARDGFERLVGLVERETGADTAMVGRFFATGMLMNVMAALDAQSAGSHWADVLTDYCLPSDTP